VLIVAWLLAALRARGPYPLLAISGEQGSAKTVLSKLLKALIDPNAAPVRALSREERELMIAANNGYQLPRMADFALWGAACETA
jgi:ABC-type phosphonate transport system ATPase subunit